MEKNNEQGQTATPHQPGSGESPNRRLRLAVGKPATVTDGLRTSAGAAISSKAALDDLRRRGRTAAPRVEFLPGQFHGFNLFRPDASAPAILSLPHRLDKCERKQATTSRISASPRPGGRGFR